MKAAQFTFYILFFSIVSEFALAQCTGGSSGGNITPTVAWTSTNTVNINGGTYRTFSATAGNIYYFSFCTADGGSSTYDTQITILDNTGVAVGAGGYSDDFCGVQSYVQWTCITTGTYRVLVNKYSCAAQASLGTLVYKYSAPLTCPSGLGTGVTNVASLPYASGAGTTCGAVDDITTLNSLVCGTSFYYTGEDKIWKFTPATTGAVTITLTSTGTYTALMLYNGCPLNGQGGTCVDYAQSSTGNKTLTVCLQAGVTYYLVLDSWSTPVCNPYTNLTISAPAAAGTCNLGSGVVNVPSLPYTSNNRTTCGAGDDLTATNTVICGSSIYFTAEDEVFVFTPATTGSSVISLTSASSYVGIMLYDGCPLISSCGASPGSCVGNDQETGGNANMCANLIAGHTYYLVVDQFAAPYCIPSYNISIGAPTTVAPGVTCANPINVASLPFSANNETTACMGNDYNNSTAGSCGTFYESGEDKVYKYVATASECIVITLTQCSTNLIGYTVYSGCPGAGGSCIGSNGGANSGVLSGSVVLPSAGTYYIIIDEWAPPNNAIYDISVQSFGTGAANDLPCNAVPLTLGVYLAGNNNCSGGAGEPAAPACWITPNTVNTVWFRVTTTSTSLRIRTQPGSLINTQIALYSGACGASMTLVACNDDAPACGSTFTYVSELYVTGLTAATTYYLAVDGYAALTGSFSVVAVDGAQSFPPAPGQECSIPNPVCNANIAVGDPGYQGVGTTCDFPGGGGNCLLSGERASSWYQIPIAANGILTFNIIPNDYPGPLPGDETDYDFALWKIQTAGVPGPDNCATISAGSAPVRCNYSYLGVTGIYNATAGTAPPAFSPSFDAAYDSQLPVMAGDVYLLIVSNFQNSTSGFSLNFGVSPVNYTPAPPTVFWSGGVDNDWFKPVNWGGCAIPSCATDAIITTASANQPVISGAGAAVKNLSILPAASLTINPGFQLQICGDYINSGNFTASATSTVLFNNAAINQNMNGSMVGANKFGNLTITKTGGAVTFLNDVDVAATFSITNATTTLNTNGKYHRVAGNFSNTGTYTPGVGTLELNGTAAQNYFNAGTINNLTMTHTGPGVTLQTNCTLGNAGALTLTQGKIITNAFEVAVTNRAAAACTAGNATSFVQGFLRRYLNATGSYDFPVGHNVKGYQRANVNFTVATTIDNLRATFNTYGALPGPLMLTECGVTYSQNALDNGYWTITASNTPTSGNYTMTLYNQNYSNAAIGFTVMKNSGSGWGLYNGTCVPCPVTAVTRLNMNGFSDFGVAQSPTTPLPIDWLSVKAKPLQKSILVSWETANEINNNHYTVQRSNDAASFTYLGTVAPDINNVSIHKYSFEDKNVEVNKLYYYRIMQVDNNGEFSYSNVVSARISTSGFNLIVQPNPFTNETEISYDLPYDAKVKLQILNSLGQTVAILLNESEQKGNHSAKINCDKINLAKGIYTLKLECNGVAYTQLLVKQE